jgi:endo-1,4-beta-D-glucanase Y
MVLTAYFGDRAEFDGLWAFAQKNFNDKKLMGWHVTCSGFTQSDGGSGSATDGDEDIGFGLIVAGVQWGGDYAAQAKTYLATLKKVDFTTCAATGRNIATAGSWQGNEACMTSGGGSNTSYWMPAYYRVFQALTGDAFWGKTADDAVTLYGLAANSKSGIIVNEVDQSGAAVQGQTYDYNSCRIPWRAALDYLWFGTAGSKKAAAGLAQFANSIGISKVVDGYNADGSPSGQYTGLNAFVGGFAVGAMADSEATADAFATYFVGIDDNNGTYYGSSLRTLYLLALSGNQWNPMETSTTPDGGPSSPSDSGSAGAGGTGVQPGAGGRGGNSGATGGHTSSGGTSSSSGGARAGGATSVDTGVSAGGGGTGSPSNAGGASESAAGAAASSGAAGTQSSSGCGCRVYRGRHFDGSALAALLLAAAAFTRRRKRGVDVFAGVGPRLP